MSFKETEPFNAKFEMFGIGDLNFISNSGSFFIILAAIVGYYFLRVFVSRLMVSCKEWKWARKLGVWTHVDRTFSRIKFAIIKLFIESYFENMLPLVLGLVAFTKFPISEFFETRDDIICTLITLLFAFLVVKVPMHGYDLLKQNFETLHLQETQN